MFAQISTTVHEGIHIVDVCGHKNIYYPQLIFEPPKHAARIDFLSS